MTPEPIPTHPIRSSIEFELFAIGKYLSIIENGLLNEQAERHEVVWRKPSISLDNKKGLKRFIEVLEHEQLFGFEVPIRIRYSYIIQLYILFESGAVRVCERLVELNKTNLKLEDLAGTKSFRTIKIFLNKLYRVNGINWSELNDFRVLRNCIVHTRGFAEDSKDAKKIIEITGRRKDIRLLDSGYIYFSKKYCEHIHATVAKFFRQIFDKGEFGPLSVAYKMGHAQEYQNLYYSEIMAEPVAGGDATR